MEESRGDFQYILHCCCLSIAKVMNSLDMPQGKLPLLLRDLPNATNRDYVWSEEMLYFAPRELVPER